MNRSHPRIRAEFYLNKIVDGIPYLVRCKDLSLGGMHVHRLLEPSFREGASMSVEFSLLNSADVLRAEVDPIWESEVGSFGLRFRQLTPRVKRHVEEYIHCAQQIAQVSRAT